jgi:hypothetical protein
MTQWTVGPQNYMIGKGVVSVVTGVPNVDYWQPLTAYAVGAAVVNFDATATDGYPIKVFVCATAGTSASSTGPHTGTLTDDTVVWTISAPTDVGNVSKFEINIKSDYEKHKTSRSGAVVQDFVAETGRDGSFSATLEEYSLENLALVSYGVISGTSPNRLGKMGGQSSQNQCWMFRGTGAHGAHFQVVVPRALVHPPKTIGFISEKLANFECEADVFGMPSDAYAFYYVAEIA